MKLLTRLATGISGVLGVVLPNIGIFHLPIATQSTITAVGGGLLALLAWLEHPTTIAASMAPTAAVTVTSPGTVVPPAPIPPKV